MTARAAVPVAGSSDLQARIRSVHAPVPVMDRDRERRLTPRQRELLDELGALFQDGFADLTMSEIASRLNCSLRTLYELAPSRDELVVTVIDRSLWRTGRTAREAIGPDVAPLDAIRSYLRAANVAVSGTTEALARDLDAMPATRRLRDGHSDYLVAVTRSLLDLAVERGDIVAVDTAAVARVLAGLGRDFSRPDVIATLASTPKDAANAVVEIVLTGLQDIAKGAADT